MSFYLDDIQSLYHLELITKQIVSGFITGFHRSPFHGFSVEFSEHRAYYTGESTRYMDWKVFAKTDKLFTKQFEEDTNLRCWLLLDTSSSMYYPIEQLGKIRFSIIASACLSYLAHIQKDAVGLITFSDKIHLQTESSSKKSHLYHLYALFEKLLMQQPVSESTQLVSTLHQVADRIPKRSLMIIFTDLLGDRIPLNELLTAFKHLAYYGHDVVLFHISDTCSEIELKFDRKEYEFVDLESGDKIKLNPLEFQNIYTTQLKSYFHELKLGLGHIGVDWVDVDIKSSIHEVLRSYLTKRMGVKK